MSEKDDLKFIKSRNDKGIFGIQKYYEPQNAFNAIGNLFGVCNVHGYGNISIGVHAFLDKIWERSLIRYADYRQNKITREEWEQTFIDRDTDSFNDYLLSFNFFIYDYRTKTYYTSLMEFGDDYMNQLDGRQWDIYEEILYEFGLYNFGSIIEGFIKDYELKCSVELNTDYRFSEDDFDEWFNDYRVDYFDVIFEQLLGKTVYKKLTKL